MKAITCTQCGATLEDVSERSLIIECQYCGARIMMPAPQEKPVEEPVRLPFVAAEPEPSSQTTFRPLLITGIAAVVFFVPIIIAIMVNRPAKPPLANADYVYSAPYKDPPVTFPDWAAKPVKPVPVVNYQPRVSWEGPNDLEHFPDPQVDLSSVSELSTEEVIKTVFKNRVVKLRVVINTEGEVDEVETISGHPLLVAAATESAKQSIFNSRSKPTKRVLTYTFRVLKD